MQRNLNAPIFNPQNYAREIPETYSLGVEIVTVTATDLDGDRVTYSIYGDAFGGTNRANEYYYIGPETGIIYLKKPLTGVTHLEDSVRNIIFLW